MATHPLKIIARIHTDFPDKFGIPRQSGMVEELKGQIVFEPEYRNPDAVRGLEDFSHIWLIWEFSEAIREDWSPTVRPPRLGGNTRKGVFATRSPFRPNPIGLSSVKLDMISFNDENGPVLHVSGADLMDGTPVYDVKPYIPFTDSHPEAIGGFADEHVNDRLQVRFPNHFLKIIPSNKQNALLEVLSLDPRPSYQDDGERSYGLEFAGFDVQFQVQDDVLTVCEVLKK